MNHKPLNFSEFVRQDFARRRLKNPRFSLRSYARILAVSPAHLSLILSNRRSIKPASALKISQGLGLTPSEMLQLFKREVGETENSGDSVHFLSGEEFNLVSRWHDFAILGLAGLRTNVADPKWISKRLRIPYEVAEHSFHQLIEHGYLKVKEGQFRQITKKVQTPHDIPSSSVRRYHKINLQLAIDKIEQVDVNLREYVSLTIPISLSKIKAAKEMIRKFKEEFASELERGHKQEVYNLNIQFFPLTDVPSKENQ